MDEYPWQTTCRNPFWKGPTKNEGGGKGFFTGFRQNREVVEICSSIGWVGGGGVRKKKWNIPSDKCQYNQELTLKDPVFWKSSHLKCKDLPAMLSRVEQVITGVLFMYCATLLAASCTSSKSTSISLDAILHQIWIENSKSWGFTSK